ncbi:MAG: antitoxin [Candidatus Competibacteraceae bacterium]|nr:MAG: antitoxin [Candidatus Competibacteraceae bacterium]
MNTKLTLRLDDGLIRSAKRHSAKSGKSISRLVADYFTLLVAREDAADTELTPRVRSLLGALSGAAIDEQDYRRHLENKHQ